MINFADKLFNLQKTRNNYWNLNKTSLKLFSEFIFKYHGPQFTPNIIRHKLARKETEIYNNGQYSAFLPVHSKPELSFVEPEDKC